MVSRLPRADAVSFTCCHVDDNTHGMSWEIKVRATVGLVLNPRDFDPFDVLYTCASGVFLFPPSTRLVMNYIVVFSTATYATFWCRSLYETR